MDRAEGWLSKQGWQKGEGLGRNKTGIQQHIKVSKKSNTLGIGAKNTQWGDDWWNKLYQNSLKNINFPDEKDKKENTKSIPVRPKEIVQLKTVKEPLLYGMFVKSSSQVDINDPTVFPTSPSSSSSSDSDSDDEVDTTKERMHHMADEDVFKACNNMVLRKYVPVGKLQRIAKQESDLNLTFTTFNLLQNSASSPSLQLNNNNDNDNDKSNNDKKKKKERKEKKEKKEKKKEKKKEEAANQIESTKEKKIVKKEGESKIKEKEERRKERKERREKRKKRQEENNKNEEENLEKKSKKNKKKSEEKEEEKEGLRESKNIEKASKKRKRDDKDGKRKKRQKVESDSD